MGFGTGSSPLVVAALWTAYASIFATFCLLAGMAFSRLLLLQRLARERRAAALWNPLIAHCAEGVPEALPRLRRSEVEAFLLLWCRAQEALRGEAQDHLREMARRLGVEAHARRLLDSGNLRTRLLALLTLGNLRARDLAPDLYTLLPVAAPLVGLAAAKTLMRIDPGLGAPALMAAAARRDDWPLGALVTLLRECDAPRVGRLLSGTIRGALGRGEGDGVARLLRLHVAADGEVLRDAVLEVLKTSDSPEALAAALAALWHPEDVGHARRLLGHPQWFVRVAAARALGRFGGAGDVERLTAALGDPNWWVRYRAAQALCALPGMSASELGELAARLGDRFAADILRQALADRKPA